MAEIKKFDHYLSHDGPVALVIRQHLMPVEGPGGVVFPATFAEGGGFSGGYNIDPPTGEKNVCLIDSVGSQANRIEPIFAQEKYKKLVPQIVVKAGADKEVTIFDAGHRAGDAAMRCSSLAPDFNQAFQSVLKGDPTPLGKLAPTSLVFGVWDSRDTQAKLPRLVASTIRAFDVAALRRGAVYVPPLDYAALEVFSEEEKAKAEGDNKNPLAKRGFVHVPASGSHGGVIAHGGIRRDATLGLAALRLLAVKGKDEETLKLRRYILGLSLVAFTYTPSGFLRQGCTLVTNPDRAKDNEFVEVLTTGERKKCSITHDDALAYAELAANEFGVGESKTVNFEKERAKQDVKSEGKQKPKKGGKKAEGAEGTGDA